MYEDKFELNQVIRSYDFRGRRDCFIEGKIVGIYKREDDAPVPYYAYELEVTRQVFDGEEQDEATNNVFTPMHSSLEYVGRLELVEHAPVKTGDVFDLKPGWQEDGDDAIEVVAVSDEVDGLVDVKPTDDAITFMGVTAIKTVWLER